MDRWEEKAGPRARVDSSRGDSLATLLRELNAIEGDFWIRLLYTHPAHWSDELIATIAACPKVARYVDMPLQHIADPMLDAMRRENSVAAHPRPGRSGIRAGVPGHRAAHDLHRRFSRRDGRGFRHAAALHRGTTRFERLGVFKYSREEGTRAAKRDGHLPARTKMARWKKGDGPAAAHRAGADRRRVGPRHSRAGRVARRGPQRGRCARRRCPRLRSKLIAARRPIRRCDRHRRPRLRSGGDVV